MNDRIRSAAAATILSCGLVYASAGAHAASLSDADHKFLVSTAQGTTYELAVAKLAMTKTTRSDIKSYAHTMIADHASLNPKLHQVAKQNNVQLPTTMTSDKQRSFNQLSALNGKEFDTAFVSGEADDNKTDTVTEQKELDTTDNTQVKALVEQLKAADTKHAKIGEMLRQAGQ